MRQGERTDLQPSANLQKVSQETAAKLLNVGRGVIAAKLANMRRDEFRGNQYKKVDSINLDYPPISLEQAAELLNVGRAIIAAKLANMKRTDTLKQYRPDVPIGTSEIVPTGAGRQR